MSTDELNVDTGSCVINNYISRLETDIVNANGEPAKVFLTEEITVNNQVGLLANREEQEAFKGPVPIDHYPINNDSVPIVLRKKPSPVECERNVIIQYNDPGIVPTPGAIIINQDANTLPPAAPPVIMRQLPSPPVILPPTVILETPPNVPSPPTNKVVNIPGNLLPPPARKIIIEKLPQLPDKPQEIQIERWLPLKDVKRKVILNPKPNSPVACKPRNVLIEWEKRECSHVKDVITNLGVVPTDPIAYRNANHGKMLTQDQMPDIVHEVQRQHNQTLAVNEHKQYYMELEGDIQGLALVEQYFGLEAVGLGEYKRYVEGVERLADRRPVNF